MIYLAADHRGFDLKEQIKDWLSEWGYEHKDMGAFENNPDDDYPDFISKAAEKVSQDPEKSKAIVLGHSGQGEAVVANKYKNVRAVVYYGSENEMITLTRLHNDANVLSVGATFVGGAIKENIKKWLDTKFEDEPRHKRRIDKIKQIEDRS